MILCISFSTSLIITLFRNPFRIISQTLRIIQIWVTDSVRFDFCLMRSGIKKGEAEIFSHPFTNSYVFRRRKIIERWMNSLWRTQKRFETRERNKKILLLLLLLFSYLGSQWGERKSFKWNFIGNYFFAETFYLFIFYYYHYFYYYYFQFADFYSEKKNY